MNINNVCQDAALASFLYVFQNFLKFIQIVGPLLCIVSLVIIFFGKVSNPEDKKSDSKIKNCLLALVITFFVPLIVNVSVSLIDENSNFRLCYENKVQKNDMNSTYIEDKNVKKHKLPDPNSYENGKPKESTGGNSNIGKYVFIGDSRTVQMYAYFSNDWSGANYSEGGVHVVGNDVYIAQGSMGLSWLKNTGMPAAQSYFLPNTAIIILMGVNDLYNVDNYISYVNSNFSSWSSKGSKIYYVSVNPCKGKRSNLNDKIDSFNSKLKSALNPSVKWIDTNSYLNSTGFNSSDGVHYDKETSKKIYDYIKSKV